MSKYIDADHLKVEMEKHIKEVMDAAERFTPNLGFFDAKLSGIYDVMAIIDSLQQEQPEVDIRSELEKYIFPISVETMKKEPFTQLEKCAHYFYELGLKARKDKLGIIDSLQRERPESSKGKFVFPNFLYARTVDNKTIDVSYAPQSMDAVEYIKNDPTEQSEADLEEEMDRFFEEMPIQEHENIFEDTYQMIARHFYELGLKSK